MSPWYAVPPENEGEFDAPLERIERVYRVSALRWRIGRSTKTPGLWSEHGPVFREEADRQTAAAELAEELERLTRFKVEYPPGTDTSFALVEVVERWPGDYETVFEVGDPMDHRGRSRPPIEPGDMTPAMRSGHELAAALVARLNPVLPAPFSVMASNELVEVYEGDRLVTWMSFVDGDPEEAVWAFIDQLQSDVSEITTEPWPRDPSGSYEFHDPTVEVRDGAIHVTFGADDAPVLALEPIPLTELEG